VESKLEVLSFKSICTSLNVALVMGLELDAATVDSGQREKVQEVTLIASKNSNLNLLLVNTSYYMNVTYRHVDEVRGLRPSAIRTHHG